MVDGNKKHKQNPSQVKHINDKESDGSGQHRSNTCQQDKESLYPTCYEALSHGMETRATPLASQLTSGWPIGHFSHLLPGLRKPLALPAFISAILRHSQL